MGHPLAYGAIATLPLGVRPTPLAPVRTELGFASRVLCQHESPPQVDPVRRNSWEIAGRVRCHLVRPRHCGRAPVKRHDGKVASLLGTEAKLCQACQEPRDPGHFRLPVSAQ